MLSQRTNKTITLPSRFARRRWANRHWQGRLAVSAAVWVAAILSIPVPLRGDEAAESARKTAQGLELFTTQVREILTQNCLKCHGGKKTEGEFDLATREGL